MQLSDYNKRKITGKDFGNVITKLSKNNFTLNYKWHHFHFFIDSTMCQESSILNSDCLAKLHGAVHTLKNLKHDCFCFDFQRA